METVEEEPWLGLGLREGRGEGRGGDDGVPELADRGGSDEGGDWEKGEDMLRQVRAQRAKFCHFQKKQKQRETERQSKGGKRR